MASEPNSFESLLGWLSLASINHPCPSFPTGSLSKPLRKPASSNQSRTYWSLSKTRLLIFARCVFLERPVSWRVRCEEFVNQDEFLFFWTITTTREFGFGSAKTTPRVWALLFRITLMTLKIFCCGDLVRLFWRLKKIKVWVEGRKERRSIKPCAGVPRRQASYVSKKFGRGFTERGYPRHLQWVCTWEKKKTE